MKQKAEAIIATNINFNNGFNIKPLNINDTATNIGEWKQYIPKALSLINLVNLLSKFNRFLKNAIIPIEKLIAINDSHNAKAKLCQ